MRGAFCIIPLEQTAPFLFQEGENLGFQAKDEALDIFQSGTEPRALARGSLFMGTISTAEFRKGMYIEFKGEPHQMVEFQHVNPGKGSAFIRTRLKSLKTGRVQDFTYKSGESVEELSIMTREMQYLYKEMDSYVFMDNENYEQFSVLAAVLGSYAHFLKENDTYQLLVYEGTVIGVRFPKKVYLKVVETQDAVRGNTVSGATKPAKLETGATIGVPLFIKEGDKIGVDPETEEYVDRVSQ